MNWEETINNFRSHSNYKQIIFDSYLEKDLSQNCTRFLQSQEFIESCILLDGNTKPNRKLLDIGGGNGISALAFALKGYEVTVVEPDPGESLGRGAIRKLAEEFRVKINIVDAFGEDLPFETGSFDLVYARQTLHHASDLKKFLSESFRVLSPGGIILTVRDHVIYNEKDKKWFLESHPFHKYYGGENAFKPREYKEAFLAAGFHLNKILRHYDSVINFYPLSREDFIKLPITRRNEFRRKLISKFGAIGKTGLLLFLYRLYKGYYPSWYNEKHIPGRNYSFLAIKPA